MQDEYPALPQSNDVLFSFWNSSLWPCTSTWAKTILLIGICITTWPSLGTHLGQAAAMLLQGILTRWLLFFECMFQSFQDAFFAFFKHTTAKWAYWLSTGSWPNSTQLENFDGSISAPETPHTIGFLMAGFLWLVARRLTNIGAGTGQPPA